MALQRKYSYDFERFWREYPVKVNKGAAYRAFEKLKLSSEDVDELVLHLERRKKDDAKWTEGKFIPHAASFLNGHRWEDEYPKVRPEAERNWSGHVETDDESLRKFWQNEHAMGRAVPDKYRHLLELH